MHVSAKRGGGGVYSSGSAEMTTQALIPIEHEWGDRTGNALFEVLRLSIPVSGDLGSHIGVSNCLARHHCS